jgi:hypothetical protein
VLAIREGELTPLHMDFTLFYTPELILHSNMIQNIELGPHTAARFRTLPDGIHGHIVRGYTFQRFATMDGGGLHKYPVLFYPLKRLEQFFVNRKTDPMYIELTNLLEKALDLMSQNHPEGLKFAEAALERGRLALEHIFPDDKLVRLLINNLEKTLALESARRAPIARPQEPVVARLEQTPDGTFEIEVDESRNLDGSSTQVKDEAWPKIRNLPV